MNGPPPPPCIDVEEMRHRLGDDDELVDDVIRLFLEDYPDRRSAIESALAARDLAALRMEAHSLKGSASHLAAHGVVAAAGALEDAAKASDLSAVDRLFALLAAETDRVVAALHELGARRGGRS